MKRKINISASNSNGMHCASTIIISQMLIVLFCILSKSSALTTFTCVYTSFLFLPCLTNITKHSVIKNHLC
uniref:Uncharacterized protein n=1 Tax=Anguilla anguilla TaxID=7936 RepID=A0A0E9RPU2_ANGAN